MKRNYTFYPLMLLLLITLNGCELVGDIFQAGMGFGIFLVLALIVLVIWVISRFRK